MRPPIVPDTREPTFWRQAVPEETLYMDDVWISTSWCGCLGPMDGAPYCPCEMRERKIKMVIVEDQPWRVRP